MTILSMQNCLLQNEEMANLVQVNDNKYTDFLKDDNSRNCELLIRSLILKNRFVVLQYSFYLFVLKNDPTKKSLSHYQNLIGGTCISLWWCLEKNWKYVHTEIQCLIIICLVLADDFTAVSSIQSAFHGII